MTATKTATRPVTGLQRHKVEGAINSAISQLNGALEALQDASPPASPADVVYRCAQCGEAVVDGRGILAWTNWDETTLVVVHKNGSGGSCDTDYQRLRGTLHHYRDLAQFLAELAKNRL